MPGILVLILTLLLAAATASQAASPAVEVRNWLLAGAGQVLTYPHPAVKLLNGATPAAAAMQTTNPQLAGGTP